MEKSRGDACGTSTIAIPRSNDALKILFETHGFEHQPSFLGQVMDGSTEALTTFKFQNLETTGKDVQV